MNRSLHVLVAVVLAAARLAKLSPEMVDASNLAGEPIIARLNPALGHGVPIDGLKVVARRGWFATRPSGAENFDRIYAKSFVDLAHPDTNVAEARTIVGRATGFAA